MEAYLEALELQRSYTASASAGQATLPFPVYAPPLKAIFTLPLGQ